jgi:tetratricopeptide (TPR) repeat protein
VKSEKDPYPNHLVHALERFPDDASLQLARIVAWTWGRDDEPMRHTEPRSRLTMRRVPPQQEAITALETLIEDPVVGPEAMVRIGQMYVALDDQPSALRYFERAAPLAADPHVRYVAWFSAGRTLDRLRRPADAMRSFAAALEVVPGAESATVALTSLGFVHDDRERAIALARATFDTATTPADPGRLVGYGSFMHWPELRAALREEAAR